MQRIHTGNDDGLTAREDQTISSLQSRLDQLVTVHRQLLRNYTSLELKNDESIKTLNLRDDRIQHLEMNALKKVESKEIYLSTTLLPKPVVTSIKNNGASIRGEKNEKTRNIKTSQDDPVTSSSTSNGYLSRFFFNNN